MLLKLKIALGAAALGLLITAGTPWAETLQLQIQEGRISVQADKVPLQNVLKRLSAYGIHVRIDPDLNPLITVSFDNKDLEEGLKILIRPLNSIYIWKPENPGSQGHAGTGPYYLAEVQVFKPGQQDRMVFLEREPDSSAARPPLEDKSDAAQIETQVIIKADRVFVPVVLGYRDKQIETTLVLDTGANSIVIHSNVAEALGITEHIQARGSGVGGVEIEARLTRLQSVRVGPFEKQDLRAAVVEYSGPPDPLYNGLLGMNFLRGLKYEIDFEGQTIRWGQTPGPTPSGQGEDDSEGEGRRNLPR